MDNQDTLCIYRTRSSGGSAPLVKSNLICSFKSKNTYIYFTNDHIQNCQCRMSADYLTRDYAWSIKVEVLDGTTIETMMRCQLLSSMVERGLDIST